ncbi:MAG: hypothetical protein ABJQ39_13835 [Winogradskyella arenosi]
MQFRNLIFLWLVLLLVTAYTDNDHDDDINCTSLLQDLVEQKAFIESYASSAICSDEFECRYLPFGSKPCGGPWSYLIYTTSIDTLELENLVNTYNAKEAEYNLNCGAISDCSVAIPPIGFNCEDQECIPIF